MSVLEKHGDFLRDFRGDTVHPSTLQLLDELGLGERFAKLPHSRLDEVSFPIDIDRSLVVADFRRLKPQRRPIPYQAALRLLRQVLPKKSHARVDPASARSSPR